MGRGLPKSVTSWVARGTILAALVATTVTYTSMQKTLVIDHNGQLSQVQVFGSTVAEALTAGNVELSDDDEVFPAGTELIGNGDVITVRKATTGATASRSDDFGREAIESLAIKEIKVAIDGAEVRTATSAATVRDALIEAGVILQEGDTLSAALDDEVTSGMRIGVGRASSDALTVTETVAFKTVEEEDDSLYEGERKVTQEGKAGETITTFQITLVDGAETERTVLAYAVLTEPKDEIVAIGTKEKPKVPSNVDMSTDETPVAAGDIASPAQAKAIAKPMVTAKGWDDSQYTCLVSLWTRESGWRVTAGNKSSGAYGIPQSLPGSKMASAGPNWRTDAATQITWGLNYIQNRYKTPCGAWDHFLRKNWY